MSVPEEILKKIATPADLGVFLIGFGEGFAVDVFGWMGGIPTVDPLTAGLGIGATALGVKQGLQGSMARRLRASRTRKRARDLARYIRSTKEPGLTRHLDTLKHIEALAETLNPDTADTALSEIEKSLFEKPRLGPP